VYLSDGIQYELIPSGAQNQTPNSGGSSGVLHFTVPISCVTAQN